MSIQHRQTETATRESEVRYRRLFETAKDGILILDTDTAKITDANPYIGELLSYAHADLIGKELWEIGLFKDIEASKAAMRELQEKRYIRYEDLPLETKAGRRIDVEFVSNVYIENQVSVIQCNIRDITERKRAEGLLRESEQRYRVLFDLGPVAVFSCNREGVIQSYNRRAAELWGREPKCGDVSERFCGSLKLYHPDGRLLPHAESPIIQVLRTGVPVNDAEVFIERPDGSRVAVMVSFSPLMTEQGEITGAITAFYDISERKRMENELRQYAADLSEADRRKNEFLAMLAHELRNPLAPIRNAVQIRRHTAQANGELRAARGEKEESCGDPLLTHHSPLTDSVDMMERQVGQMVRLVDDLLDVSRISRGKIELRRERIELASVVHHAVEAARSLAQCMEHDLTVTLPPQPVYLNADPARLAQVVSNLLNNACKFTDQGGRILLTVELRGEPGASATGGLRQLARKSAVADAPGSPEQVLIRVRDTGIGIAADQLPRIFDMFTQVDTSLERSTSGLGIGLTLVKNLVEMHGGTVEARSAGIGQGSEFIVRLPLWKDEGGRMKDESETDPVHPSSFRLHPSAKLRILVVDDNHDSARSLAMLLKLIGHEVHTAHDGLEAVEAAAKAGLDVILLDIGLPKLNGYEAAHRIREQRGNGVVLVALTGWGQEEDRRRSEEAGFDAYMVKPVDFAVLTKLLAELPPTLT